MKSVKGVALITAMLIVALASILATQMLARMQYQLQRTTNITFNQQAYWYALGAEAFAQRLLIETFEDEGKVTHLGQDWAQGENTFPVDFGEITGEISDLQACLNLNALRAETGQNEKNQAGEALKELIVILNIEGIGEFEAQYMVDALTDWLDEDTSIVSAGGAEDSDYGAKELPYLPANSYLASVGELRVIEHFTVPVITAIKPFVCVLPQSSEHKININTISEEQPELLQALLGISSSEASDLLSERKEEGYERVEDFFTSQAFAKLKVSEQQKQQFVVDSEYFTLKAKASFNNSYFALKTVFEVSKNNQITVVSRTVGRD
jgi:general secretion pathway protein K